MDTKPYIGFSANPLRATYFRSASVPTESSHGDRFAMVMGPFRTAHAARFYAHCGIGNPHVQTVSDCERIAKRFIRNADGSFTRI